MDNYDKLRRNLMESVKDGKLNEEAEKIGAEITEQDRRAFDSLMNPQKYATVVQLADCVCTEESKSACEINCLFDAIKRDEGGKLTISGDCTGCGRCIESCENHVLAGRTDIIPLMELLKQNETPVYAMIAPAFSAASRSGGSSSVVIKSDPK